MCSRIALLLRVATSLHYVVVFGHFVTLCCAPRCAWLHRALMSLRDVTTLFTAALGRRALSLRSGIVLPCRRAMLLQGITGPRCHNMAPLSYSLTSLWGIFTLPPDMAVQSCCVELPNHYAIPPFFNRFKFLPLPAVSFSRHRSLTPLPLDSTSR
jgi:hypothetical protein